MAQRRESSSGCSGSFSCATAPATPAWYTGEPVFVTGGKAFKRKAGGKDLEEIDTPASDPYAWPLAHDVREVGLSPGIAD